MSSSNQFSDMTAEEFVELMNNDSIVPEYIVNPSELAFSVRQEYVPVVDFINKELPTYKNWFEEGFISVP